MYADEDDRRIRVMLVDDHRVVREGFAVLLGLQKDIAVVGQAGSGRESVALYRQLQPDVTLMDLSLPDIDGVSAIRLIRQEFPDACIAVLTTFDNDERILEAVRNGARTYLIKTVASHDLFRTIRELADGRATDPRTNRAAERTERELLTERELVVLRRMAVGQRNETIAEALQISLNTVKSHVRAILRKLDAESRTQAVAHALARNIIDAPTR